MVSPDDPDETVGAEMAPAEGMPRAASLAALPPAGPPVYSPSSRPVSWAFVVAFLLATAASALIVMLLLT